MMFPRCGFPHMTNLLLYSFKLPTTSYFHQQTNLPLHSFKPSSLLKPNHPPMNKPTPPTALCSITKAFLAFWKRRTVEPETLTKRHKEAKKTSAIFTFIGGPLDGVIGRPEDLHNGGDILSNGYYLPTDEDNVFQYSEAL